MICSEVQYTDSGLVFKVGVVNMYFFYNIFLPILILLFGVYILLEICSNEESLKVTKREYFAFWPTTKLGRHCVMFLILTFLLISLAEMDPMPMMYFLILWFFVWMISNMDDDGV